MYMYTYTRIYIPIHIHIYINDSTYIYMVPFFTQFARMGLCIYACTHVRAYLSVSSETCQIHKQTRARIHVYIHTHIIIIINYTYTTLGTLAILHFYRDLPAIRQS